MSIEGRGDESGTLKPRPGEVEPPHNTTHAGVDQSATTHPPVPPTLNPAPQPASEKISDLRSGVEAVPGYVLERQLGKGGFGEVWEARGPGGFAVALKFVSLAGYGITVERRSLEIIKGIRHANLLTTFGSWEFSDHLVVAMELADRTLGDRFKEAVAQGLPGLPREELLEYFQQAAMGIDFLNEPHQLSDGSHRAGVQHRDLKPENILLVGNSVKVADFGLARLLERSVTGHTGSMTPHFAAPEFLKGQTSNRSDQYCLAVTYCFLRTGRLPFNGTVEQVLIGHLQGDPDLSLLPESERRIVTRALSKKPSDRWPNCRAFVSALAGGETASETPAPHPAKRESINAPKSRAVSARTVRGALAGGAALLLVLPLMYLLGVGKDPAVDDPSKPNAAQGEPRPAPTDSVRPAETAAVPPNTPVSEKPAYTPAPNRPPTIEISGIEPSQPEAGGKLTVYLQASDPDGDTVRYQYRTSDADNWQDAANGRVALADLKAGPLSVQVRAVDARGEMSPAFSRSIDVLRANRPPSVEIASADPLIPVAGGSLTVKLRGTDPDGDEPLTYQYRTDSTAAWQLAAAGTVTLRDLTPGSLRLEVRATDRRGLDSAVAVRLLDIKRPNRPPSVEITRVAPGELRRPMANSIGIQLMPIPSGEFMMAAAGEKGYAESEEPDERPRHRVQITQPFFLGAYEVTQAEYERVMRTNPSYFAPGGKHATAVTGTNTARFPVENVSWDDAQEFCRTLSALPEERAAGRSYRLPTEAEWEYACRAGTTTIFHFGNSLAATQANYNGNDPYGGAAKGKYWGRPREVGSYAPNVWGLFDMHGNVWEWCEDAYDAEFYKTSGATVPDPVNRTADKTKPRVVRGGSWNNLGSYLRAANRFRGTAVNRYYDIGFRVVCVARTP